ncbi:rhomboid family intramembrane serine protease [Candidatus Hodarchaeum mangrovi]
MKKYSYFDRFSYKVPSFIGTLLLVFVLISIYLIGMIFFPFNLFIQSPSFISKYGQNNNLIFQGELFRLITAMLIHANIVHLLSNILFLIIFGIRLEEIKSSWEVIITFIIGGFIGNCASIFWLFFSIDFISLGASGAVFALLGAIFYSIPKKSKYERRKIIYLLIIFFLITIGNDTNVIAHFFGFLGGICSSILLSRILKK